MFYDFLSLKMMIMYLQKVPNKQKNFLLTSWRSLTKIAGSGYGSISQRYGPGSRIHIKNPACSNNIVPAVPVPDNVGMFVALPEELHLPVCNGEAGGQHPLHSHVPVVKFTLNIWLTNHQIVRNKNLKK